MVVGLTEQINLLRVLGEGRREVDPSRIVVSRAGARIDLNVGDSDINVAESTLWSGASGRIADANVDHPGRIRSRLAAATTEQKKG